MLCFAVAVFYLKARVFEQIFQIFYLVITLSTKGLIYLVEPPYIMALIKFWWTLIVFWWTFSTVFACKTDRLKFPPREDFFNSE